MEIRIDKKKKNIALHSIVRNDLLVGNRQNVAIYAMTLVFSITATICFYRIIQSKIRVGIMGDEPGFCNFVTYILGGVKSFAQDEEKSIKLPVMWLAVQMLICASVYLYPIRDLFGRGEIILLKYQSRGLWWLGKCIWSVIQVVIIYGLLFLGIFFVCCMNRKFGYDTQIDIRQHGISITNISLFYIMEILIPVVYSISMVLVQINLSMIISPVFAVLCIVAYDIFSIYIEVPWLCGNFSMLFRCQELTGSGMSFGYGMILSPLMAFGITLYGVWFFKKRDLLNKI